MTDSPLLTMADAYYMVARDLEENGRQQLQIADRLNKYADRLCEQNMRETQQSPQPESRSDG